LAGKINPEAVIPCIEYCPLRGEVSVFSCDSVGVVSVFLSLMHRRGKKNTAP